MCVCLRTVWEPKEPAVLSERERKNRLPEKSWNSYHYSATVLSVYKFLAPLRRLSRAAGSKIASCSCAEGGGLSAEGYLE